MKPPELLEVPDVPAPAPAPPSGARAGQRLQDLISRGIHHRSGPVRKCVRLLLHAPRLVHRGTDSAVQRRLAPPVLGNSVPKSGTHLLDQILAALPRRRNYGRFLESMTASYVFRERTEASVLAYVSGLVSGELVRAHLHHAPAVEAALERLGIAHYLVYRDPRDVVVSEAHYLRAMTPWHRLHPHFRDCASFEEAVLLAIEGLDPARANLSYPDVGRRFARFVPWIRCPAVHAVRFEDLVSPHRRRALEELVGHYARRAGEAVDVAAVAAEAEARIAPERSHTFRQGGSGSWRSVFTPRHTAAFKRVAGDLLVELGYEASYDW